MKPSFNQTFFEVTATIIPVLFLALTLQGNFLVKVTSATVRVGEAYIESLKDLFKKLLAGEAPSAQLGGFLGGVFYVMSLFCVAVVGGSIWAEIVSLLALKDQEVSAASETYVFVVTAGLVVIIGLACVVTIFAEAIMKRKTP